MDIFDVLGLHLSTPATFQDPSNVDSAPDTVALLATPDPAFSDSRTQLLSLLSPHLEQNKTIPIGSFCSHPSCRKRKTTTIQTTVRMRKKRNPIQTNAEDVGNG